jgi:uncharacterized membrane protein
MMHKKGVWIIAGIAIAVFAFAIRMRSARTELTAIKGLDTVEIPTSSIVPGEVRFFAYRTNTGGEVRVIVGRDERGNIQAVLDACERCYMYHRGYKAAHGVMTCQWCGTRYKIGSMSTGLASCVPVKLPFKTAGPAIQIQTAELERQSKLF